MFEFVRSHTRLLQFILVLLIFPSFVFFGIQGYSRFTEGGQTQVAEVDGAGITQAEWDLAHQRQVERARRQMPGIDARLFDSPEVRRETLDALIRERVLATAAVRQNIAVSDDRLQRLFRSDPQFEGLRNADGSVNRDLLAAQGLSSEAFAQQLRRDLSISQVQSGITGTVLAPPAAASTAFDALLQRREIRYQRFDAAAYRAKVSPSDADLEAFYKDPANAELFRAPEQAQIEYVVLDVEVLKKAVAVSEQKLREYYDQNASRYTAAEQRRASHILVAADKGAPADVRQKAKARAEELLAQVRKNPASFAEVAKKSSEDPGSAAQGGDLDWFGRGAMTGPFDAAVFAMKAGEISNLVETDFGYHIIRLDAIRGGERRPFEAVRAEIEDEVRRQLAQRQFAESAEQFTNLVYEQPESLQPAIDKLKLDKRSATVQRTPAPGVTGALASPKLLEAVFSGDSITLKRNTQAIEVGPSQLASARIVQHTPARTLAFDEVRDRVREQAVTRQAAALARQAGEALLAQLDKGGDGALPQSATVSRLQNEGLPPPVIDAVLRADPAKLPRPVGVDLKEAGYLVALVQKVLPPAIESGDLPRLRAQYAQAWAAAEGQAYYDALKRRYKVEIKPAAATATASEPAR